jgi:hypothetical protein
MIHGPMVAPSKQKEIEMTDKVKTITKSELTRIEQVISDLITETLECDLGIEFRFNGGQYSNDSTGNLKIELTVKGGLTQEELLLDNSWRHFGFIKSPLGEQMYLGGRNFVVKGLKPRARKDEFLVQEIEGDFDGTGKTGNVYRMSAEQVCLGLHQFDLSWPAKPWETVSPLQEKKGEWSK